MTAKRIGEVLWRQKLVCAVVFVAILAVGSAVVLTRPASYQSSSSVALLPPPKKPAILPNYPNIIISLVPTYVQLISSPTLLNDVAAKLPFAITEQQLAADIHGESLSNAGVINIVVQSSNPGQVQQIAAVATQVFLAHVSGNGVVIPRVYGQPTAPHAAPPSKKLLLPIVAILAAILAAFAGLTWDRFAGPVPLFGKRTGMTGRVPSPGHLAEPDGVPAQHKRAAPTASGIARPIEPLESVKLRRRGQKTEEPRAPVKPKMRDANGEDGQEDKAN
jgi:capsular polysaccharide biosynthesis protein